MYPRHQMSHCATDSDTSDDTDFGDDSPGIDLTREQFN